MSTRLINVQRIVAPPPRRLTAVGRIDMRLTQLELLRAFGFVPEIAGGALVVPNQGEDIALKYLLKVDVPTDLTLRLYTDNTTPGETDTEAAGYTEFGATMSYVAVALTPSSWVFTPGAPSLAAYPMVTWTFSAGGPVSVYGYFVTRVDGKLVWAERFASPPFIVSNTGDKIDITLNITAA